MNNPLYYDWNGFSCAYYLNKPTNADFSLPLVLIHPIGVGLSSQFWQRFCQAWQDMGQSYPIYSPDLLGCGQSAMPSIAYYPQDWARQLGYFIEKIVQKPVIIVVQGALFPVAIKLTTLTPNYIKGLVLSGPPAWRLMTKATSPTKQKLVWNLFFNSPVGIGSLFYRYARRRAFLQSFSTRQLFASPQDVDTMWLDTLAKGAEDLQSRYAVFSFLAGFWREDYEKAICELKKPTLTLFGDQASSITKEGNKETPEDRLNTYLKYLPNGEGKIIPGRNVLPYESTQAFAKAVAHFVTQL